LWRACTATGVREQGGDLYLDVPFQALLTSPQVSEDSALPRRTLSVRVRAYGPAMLRL
jgi:alpha-D-xyloside xylohydrolase